MSLKSVENRAVSMSTMSFYVVRGQLLTKYSDTKPSAKLITDLVTNDAGVNVFTDDVAAI